MTSDFDPQKPVPNRDPQGEREMVDLEFATLRIFRQQMAPRLAEDGMFVSTTAPLPRGTPVRFRIVLPEEFVLADGDAIVAWRRTRATHPDVEPGMALWFEDVEKRSMDIIQELVDIQKTSGAEVFDSRRGAGEAGDFVANEFAGSFAPSTDIMRRDIAKDPEVPAFDSRERDEAPAAEVPPLGRMSEEENKPSVESPSEGGSFSESKGGFTAPEPPAGRGAEFEADMMMDDSEPDVTPLSETAGAIPDMEVTLGGTQKPTGRPRLRPLAGLAVVLLAVTAVVVWWTIIRPHEGQTPEVLQAVEAEPTAAAVVLLDDSDSEPVATPVEVAEEEPQPPVAMIEKAPATRVIDVGIARLGDATVVGIQGNGEFEDSRVQVSVLPDPSRVLVRIAEIETYYRPNEIEVGSPEVLQVRVGHHPEQTPAKLYVVLDLADESVVIRDTSVAGDTIRIVVGRK